MLGHRLSQLLGNCLLRRRHFRSQFQIGMYWTHAVTPVLDHPFSLSLKPRTDLLVFEQSLIVAYTAATWQDGSRLPITPTYSLASGDNCCPTF